MLNYESSRLNLTINLKLLNILCDNDNSTDFFLFFPYRDYRSYFVNIRGREDRLKRDVDRDFIAVTPTMRGCELLIRKLSRYPGNRRAVIGEITTFRNGTFNPFHPELSRSTAHERFLLFLSRSSRVETILGWNIVSARDSTFTLEDRIIVFDYG